MKKIMLLSGLFVGGMVLSGCASPYKNSFDCPYGPGLGCTSLSTVNKIIDTQRLDVQADLMGQEKRRDGDQGKRVFVYFGDDKPSKIIHILPEEN